MILNKVVKSTLLLSRRDLSRRSTELLVEKLTSSVNIEKRLSIVWPLFHISLFNSLKVLQSSQQRRLKYSIHYLVCFCSN